MLLDAETLDLAPNAPEVIDALGGDPRFKLEMPAAQLEIVTAPHAHRRRGGARARPGPRRARARLAGALPGCRRRRTPVRVGPRDAQPGARYEAIGAEYAGVARRQLVFGLHVHVASGEPTARSPSTTRSALTCRSSPRWPPTPRSTRAATRAGVGALPDLGAAAAPGRPARPARAATPTRRRCAGARSTTRAGGGGSCACTPCSGRSRSACRTRRRRSRTPRPSARSCTRSSRVSPPATTRGEALPVAESWRIDQNRWSACRHGVDGAMTDLATGERRPTRERLEALLDSLELEPEPLARARAMLVSNGAARQRAVAAERGLHGLAGWLADGFGQAGVSSADAVWVGPGRDRAA